MARDILKVWLRLENVHCYDEGDGWGSAEPYLWNVFFRIDGQSVFLNDSLRLSGTAYVEGRPGSHGDLNNQDVDAGDDVSIPEDIGNWETHLKPIPVPSWLKGLVDDVPGVVGVVSILMEEDTVTDDGAEARRQALVSGVRDALNQLIPSLGFDRPEITDADINAFTSQIRGRIEDAVANQQSWFENLWAWLNKDDTIGTKVWYFRHDDFATGNVIPFSQRWKNEGDWEFTGHVNATLFCPAGFVAALAGNPRSETGIQSPVEPSMTLMRAFRAKEMTRWPGLADWWDLAVRNMPQFSYAIQRDNELGTAALNLLAGIHEMLTDREKPLPEGLLLTSRAVLEKMEHAGTRRTRIDGRRALDVLTELRGKNAPSAFDVLSALRPARHPRTAGGLRVSRRK